MVWKTKRGQKYHSRPDCGNMKNASQISKSEAEKKYGPCDNC